MDGPINIPGDLAKQAIQGSIKQKLSEITGSKVDDVLPEYVMVMVVNQKTKAQVASDLEAFLGQDQAVTFTAWLWDALHAMNSDSGKKVEPKRPSEEENRNRSRDERDSRRDRDSNRDREPSPNRSVFASVITVPSTAERSRTNLDNPAPARLILSAVQDAVKSTSSPAPSRPTYDEPEPDNSRDNRRNRDNRDRDNRDNRDNYRDNYRDRDNNRGEYKERVYFTRNRDNKPRGDVMDRLGTRDSDMEDTRRRDDRDRRPRRDNNNNSPSISSRLGGSSPSNLSNNVYLPDKRTDGEDAAVTFTVTLNGVKEEDPVDKPLRNKRRSFEPEENGEEEADEPMEGGGKKVKKERCQYWPNCKRGNECAFFHPTQNCKLFPNCTYGDSCLFIHPSVPCKFGVKCTRADCAFSHPSRAAAAATTASTTPLPASIPSSLPVVRAINSALPTPRNPTFTPSGKPCKHGFACPTRSDGCSFYHPPPACMFGEACENPKCAFAHGKPCRSGVTCTTPGCTFVHAAQINTPCKFGAGCLNTSCRFRHDDKAAASDASMADAEDTSDISASLPKTPPTA